MHVDVAARWLDALGARTGIVCAVGAGGKKSTLRRLAEAAEGLGIGPLAITATVLVAPFADDGGRPVVVAPPDRLEPELRALIEAGRTSLAYACPTTKPLRLGGVPPELVRRLHDRHRFALTLVKADGARMRAIKAPKPDEPVLPPASDLILPIVSAQAIGRPLDERIAHRVDRLSDLTGRAVGEAIRPCDLANLLAHPAGGLRHTGAAAVVPIINAVDDAERHRLAREAAEGALARTERFDRVVLATMIRADPLVEIVRRH